MNFRQIKRGDVVLMKYRNQPPFEVTFRGFTDWDEANSYIPQFHSLGQVMEAKGARSLAELEALHESRGYGLEVRAIFDEGGRYEFAAYLWKGRWRVGTSADAVTLLPLAD